MWASYGIRFVAATILLGSTILFCGCRRQSAEEESPETPQARVQADRIAALKYLKKDGRIDWRKRVDEASEAIDEAKSDRRWGRNEEALKHALRAAQLLPPPSKDFDAASGQPNGHEEQGTEESKSVDGPDDHEFPGDGDLLANEGNPVSNDEVQQLRESLQSLLESLDGKAGRARSGLSSQRDAIEIR